MRTAQKIKRIYEYVQTLPTSRSAERAEIIRVFDMTWGLIESLQRELCTLTPKGREWIDQMFEGVTYGWTSGDGDSAVTVRPADLDY